MLKEYIFTGACDFQFKLKKIVENAHFLQGVQLGALREGCNSATHSLVRC